MLNAAQARTYAKPSATVHGAFGGCDTTNSAARPLVQPLGAAALTPAQTTVAKLAAEGKPNREIARALGRSEEVVKIHIRAAMKKCGVTSRTAFVHVFPPPAAEDTAPIAFGTREVQVLALVAEGRPNKQIGLDLGISEATVKVYLKSVLAKLRLSNRTEAARWFVARQPVAGA